MRIYCYWGLKSDIAIGSIPPHRAANKIVNVIRKKFDETDDLTDEDHEWIQNAFHDLGRMYFSSLEEQ